MLALQVNDSPVVLGPSKLTNASLGPDKLPWAGITTGKFPDEVSPAT
jgi:hypothetical protein